MFMNADGWPVVAPYRYANETQPAFLRPEFVFGDYLYVNHGKDITATIKKSQLITLNANGSITGAVTGTWRRPGGNQIEISLPGASTYKGVLLTEWDETSKSYVTTFTASAARRCCGRDRTGMTRAWA
jgi:arabinan endo-1,5-alpha-L-arabinosidase